MKFKLAFALSILLCISNTAMGQERRSFYYGNLFNSLTSLYNFTLDNKESVEDINQRIDSVMSDMKYLEKNLSGGIASAVAMGQHQFDTKYQGSQVSISGGHFNGENAVSLAVGIPASSNTFFSASVAANSAAGNESIGMGLTIRLP